MLRKLEFLTADNAQRRAQDNTQVEPERACFKIMQVHAQADEHFLHGVGVAVVERRLRRQPGAHQVNKLILGRNGHYLVDVILALRSRTYERHVALKHVPQLWQLVKMVLAQEALRNGRAGAAVARSEAGRRFNAAHRTELVYRKRPSAVTYAFLGEYHRPVLLPLQHNINDKEQRRQHDQAYKGRRKVEGPLNGPLRGAHGVAPAHGKVCFFAVYGVHFYLFFLIYNPKIRKLLQR